MGIKGLTRFIAETAPNAIKNVAIESLLGRVIAIDASLYLYQFIIAIRNNTGNYGALTNESGENTSHIVGFISRTLRMLEAGIKPVYVFDGSPPKLKSGELTRRGEKRAAAEMELKEAHEAGDAEKIKQFVKRVVYVTKKHNEDAKQLLRLMGIPIVQAPSEAEAQCAVLCKEKKVYGVATEDADVLTFGSPVLIRHLNSDKNMKIMEISLEEVLKSLNMDMKQFIDFSILCGCDYSDSIKGIGPSKAFKLLQKHGNIDKILLNIDKSKYPVPSQFLYQEARELFLEPQVEEGMEIEPGKQDIEGLRSYLMAASFSHDRIEGYINRLVNSKDKNRQLRLESFFGCTRIKRPELIQGNEKKPKRGKQKK